MRNKLFAIISLALVLCFIYVPTLGAYDASVADAISHSIDGGNFQKALEDESVSEWYVLAQLRRGVQADYSVYTDALKSVIENEGEPASTRQRAALTLMLINGKNTLSDKTLGETAGKQGLMSYVFALHLMNNSATYDGVDTADVIDAIMSLRLSDGGWAVRGNTSDVDVTAMVLQALAPYKENFSEIIEGALTVLSEKQLGDGDYLSYGVANPESGAQVIIALTSLEIDPLTDKRFIKNGKSLVDGMLKYLLPDGGVSHTLGGKQSQTASCQTYCALVALERFYNGQSGFYIFEDEAESDESAVSEEQSDESEDIPSGTSEEESSATLTEESAESSDEVKERDSSYKPTVCIVIGVITLAAVIFLIAKKHKLSDIVIAVIIGGVLIAGVLLINIESADEHFKTVSKEQAIGEVTISVICPAANKDFVAKQSFPLADGETAFDILTQVAKEHNITVAFSKSGGDVYVTAIGGIGEFDYGNMSGWTYTVNGETPPISASAFVLSDGDVIEWIYVTE